MPVKKVEKEETVKKSTEKKTATKAAAKKAPAKKAAEEKPAKKAAEKKVTATKTETKKAAAPKKETAAKATTKKAAAPKKETTAKKAPAKKAAAPKKETAAKKAPAKKAAAKKPEVFKQSVQHYEDVINWKKGEAHAMDWLYIEINAGDLLTEVEAGVDNLDTCCKAILNCMLEGDGYIVEPSEEDKVSDRLTVRYYCDNLSADRRKYFDVL